jgi:hypothetical protein
MPFFAAGMRATKERVSLFDFEQYRSKTRNDSEAGLHLRPVLSSLSRAMGVSLTRIQPYIDNLPRVLGRCVVMLRRSPADPLRHAWRLALLLGAAGGLLGWLFTWLARPDVAGVPPDAWQPTALLIALTGLLGYAVGASIALGSVSR